MQLEFKQELASFGIVAINAIPIFPSFVKKWLIRHVIGLTPLQAHILVERAAMYKPITVRIRLKNGSYVNRKWKTLWQYIMWRDERQCQIRTKGICITVATQVDHVVAVFRFGRSIPSNLQAACQPCNRLKGISIIEKQLEAARGTRVILVLLFIVIVLFSLVFHQIVLYLHF
jgi:HNH endonuclease